MTAGKNRLSRRFTMAAVPLLLASLAACTTPFKADVSRFQSQLPAPTGQSFAVVADDPSMAGGLEFSQYAQLVEAQMVRLGYAQAEPTNATLLVRFDFGVDQGREKVRTTGYYHDRFYSPWYGYRSYGYWPGYYRSSAWGYGWNDPWFGGPEVTSYTVYTSGVDVKIDRASDNARLFEGSAQALSPSNRLQYLVPNLVEAMFTDFPGNSGETVRITIAPEKKTVKKVD